MNRRGFFGLVAGGLTAAALPGELWVPGERKVFLPPRGGWFTPWEGLWMATRSADGQEMFQRVPLLPRAYPNSLPPGYLDGVLVPDHFSASPVASFAVYKDGRLMKTAAEVGGYGIKNHYTTWVVTL